MFRAVLMSLSFVAAQLLAGSAIAGARQAEPLNERFAPVATYRLADPLGRPTGMIVLQLGRFHCSKGSARAVWFQWVNGVAVIGCWRDEGTKYVAEFEDNDRRELEKSKQGHPDVGAAVQGETNATGRRDL